MSLCSINLNIGLYKNQTSNICVQASSLWAGVGVALQPGMATWCSEVCYGVAWHHFIVSVMIRARAYPISSCMIPWICFHTILIWSNIVWITKPYSIIHTKIWITWITMNFIFHEDMVWKSKEYGKKLVFPFLTPGISVTNPSKAWTFGNME